MVRRNAKRGIKVAARRHRPGARTGSGARNSNPYARRSRKSKARAGHRRLSRETAAKRQLEALNQAAVKDFENAARYFQKQKYDKAREIFADLVNAPAREVAARARVHLQLCEQKLNSTGKRAAAKTAEDFYNLGVIQLNARALDQAIEYLSQADKLAPNQEHIRYALAAARALQGSTDAALEHLSAAIELRPQNRIRARRDDDFTPLAEEPRFKQLVSS